MASLQNLLPLVLIAAVFYLLLIRPQRNRQRQAQTLLSRMAPGDRVMTSSGLFGTVVEMDDDGVQLEIAPGVEVRFLKAAVQRIVTPEADAVDAGESDVLDEDLAGDVDDDTGDDSRRRDDVRDDEDPRDHDLDVRDAPRDRTGATLAPAPSERD